MVVSIEKIQSILGFDQAENELLFFVVFQEEVFVPDNEVKLCVVVDVKESIAAKNSRKSFAGNRQNLSQSQGLFVEGISPEFFSSGHHQQSAFFIPPDFLGPVLERMDRLFDPVPIVEQHRFGACDCQEKSIKKPLGHKWDFYGRRVLELVVHVYNIVFQNCEICFVAPDETGP